MCRHLFVFFFFALFECTVFGQSMDWHGLIRCFATQRKSIDRKIDGRYVRRDILYDLSFATTFETVSQVLSLSLFVTVNCFDYQTFSPYLSSSVKRNAILHAALHFHFCLFFFFVILYSCSAIVDSFAK